MSGLLPDSSLVPVGPPLCLERGGYWKTADSLNFVLDGENRQCLTLHYVHNK